MGSEELLIIANHKDYIKEPGYHNVFEGGTRSIIRNFPGSDCPSHKLKLPSKVKDAVTTNTLLI